jgi:hypothetical protein
VSVWEFREGADGLVKALGSGFVPLVSVLVLEGICAMHDRRGVWQLKEVGWGELCAMWE